MIGVASNIAVLIVSYPRGIHVRESIPRCESTAAFLHGPLHLEADRKRDPIASTYCNQVCVRGRTAERDRETEARRHEHAAVLCDTQENACADRNATVTPRARESRSSVDPTFGTYQLPVHEATEYASSTRVKTFIVN